MREITIVGNWKMHTTLLEASDLARAVSDACQEMGGDGPQVAVVPPFTALARVREVLQGSCVQLGAQNMSDALSGAHTGEISVTQLKDVGVTMVIVGHSERRHIYGEDDEAVNRKVRLALEASVTPILCVGERIEEREGGHAVSVCTQQLERGLHHVSLPQMARLIVAYEPVWAIGSGRVATPRDANDMHRALRAHVARRYNRTVAERCGILYGGSVKPENAAALLAESDIDGALVGGASLKKDSFGAIVHHGIAASKREHGTAASERA